ncbi:NADH dehydrogenase [ubiquinone] iron-sulfur protein 2, mitochondrial-like [Photinus pyralis]|nr:NADH dehydrogenase [ubiquinone] iron-sulfur protein 2, mitochondrial-like [Photinus pyralis]
MSLLSRILMKISSRPNTRFMQKWYPDAEWFRQFDGPVMFNREKFKHWKIQPWNGKLPMVEKKVRNMVINFGPAHPAAHGVLRLICELEGEVIRRIDPHIGHLHRGTEKLCEHKTYLQALPYFDRFDYVSPMCNEHAFCLALEKLLNIDIPRRAKFIRTIFIELTRLLSHGLSAASQLLDAGAITPVFWVFEEREKIWEFCERVSGGRVHSIYFRVGGVARDLPIGLLDDIQLFTERFCQRLDEIEDVTTNNRIWLARNVGIGAISAEDAINTGCSGTNLRATGVKWDLRKNLPYEIYDELDFDVPVGANGDCHDRWLCKMYEMRQSCRIIGQCLNKMPEGDVKVDDYKITPPTRMEMKDERAPDILAAVALDPHVSTRRLAIDAGMSQMTAWRILNGNKLYPYHVNLHQALGGQDFQRRLDFCEWLLNQNQNFHHKILWTDEATFKSSGDVNIHNAHYWSRENPHWLREVDNQNVWSLNTWCGILGGRIIGPHFFDGHLNGSVYNDFLENILYDLLDNVPIAIRAEMWLQQDGCPAHFSRVSRQTVNRLFPNRWMGRGGPFPWPARSPDLTPLDFFLWGRVKDIVYQQRPTTRENMKERIRNACRLLNENEVLRAVDNVRLRLQNCINQNGRHFEHIN